ncbi:transcriptional regulator with XRE-family HTH domain [Nocardioides albertanoniae]|uniref:Transcriptional regulator with XRE-family HTH domain n=1 Tax=Nocardioides albertanoniae TaxID=1175486 RepID=A0A543A2X0_9ACTN|nr:helix-turn-helix transcriptional regulator [Nocardioides albertanoniae]TQL66921.1 transcriptional regulator with XRE-family HTH domain [Nocardioides albertanoniae]
MPRPDHRAAEALTEALRDARRSAGFTGAGLADALGSGWAQPKVSKIESGRQVPSAADIQAWAEATGVDPEKFVALHARARHEVSALREARRSAGGVEGRQEAYAIAESAAQVLASVHPSMVPDLVQTPDYARALLALAGAGGGDADPEEASSAIASRLRRSAVLYEPGRSITILLGEAALRHLIGSPSIMRAQIEHIGRLATSTRATIGIVPFESVPVLLRHGWDQRDKIVTVETTAGDLEVADPAEVARYERWTRLLLEHALVGQEAADRCAEILERREDRHRPGGATP